MIEITPAILTNDINFFRNKSKEFLQFGDIDIDIISKTFVDNETVSVNTILVNNLCGEYEKIGFHLMISIPEDEVRKLLSSDFRNKNVRIYIHQEVEYNINFNASIPSNWEIGVALKAESELRDLGYYNQFREVQFMTVDIGFQGNSFKPEVLDKVDTLRSLGYNGKISIDGGVNLETARLIKQHSVDRVSVGSYLSRAEDPAKAYNELDRALNSND